MKVLILAASLLVASAGMSFAESDGDAFGQHLTGAPRTHATAPLAPRLPQAADVARQVPAETPSMGIVQSGNSLPRGFNGSGPSAPASGVAGVPAPGQPVPAYAQLLPSPSGMAVVQTANSLPR